MVFSKEKIVINSFFILSFIALFLLNNDRQSESNLFLLNLTLSIFTLFFILLIPIGVRYNLHSKFKPFDFVLFFACAICTVIVFMVRGYVVVHLIYLIVFYIIINSNNVYIPRLERNVFLALGVLSILMQLMIFRLDGRLVLSYIDPNYSSLAIFLFSVYVYYSLGKVYSLFPFLLGLIPLSRAYVLVCLVFFSLEYLVKYKPYKKIMLFICRPWVSFLIIMILPLAINYIFVLYVSPDSAPVTSVDNKFSGNLIDRSNLDRSLASVLFVNQLVTNPFAYIWGADLDKYLSTVFINSPHHSFFQLILNYGWLFSFPYIMLFLNCCYSACLKNNSAMPFYLAFFIYIMTLGGGMFGMTLIFIGFIFRARF
nr:Wzy [Plesiomonas shigelloides]